jgi:ribosome maturation factor rimP
VSSPGLDRPLFAFADFVRFTGQTVKLNLHTPLGKRRRFEGAIVATAEAAQRITLQIPNGKETETVEIDFANVDKARLVPVF